MKEFVCPNKCGTFVIDEKGVTWSCGKCGELMVMVNRPRLQTVVLFLHFRLYIWNVLGLATGITSTIYGVWFLTSSNKALLTRAIAFLAVSYFIIAVDRILFSRLTDKWTADIE